MPDDPTSEIHASGQAHAIIHSPPRPPSPWTPAFEALREAGFECSQPAFDNPPKPGGHFNRSGCTLRREGNRITYQSGSEKVLWSVDIEGADEGAIDDFLNRVFGVHSDGETSTLQRLDIAIAVDYGPCFNLGRLIWAGRPLAANRPLRRLLWALRYRLPHYRRWIVDPIVSPELRRSAETLCAATLLEALDPARIKKALVEIGEIGDSQEEHPYAKWRAVLRELWSQLPQPGLAPTTDTAPTISNTSAIEAIQRARERIATALAALDSIQAPSPSQPDPSPP